MLDSGRGIRKITETTWWRTDDKLKSQSTYEFNDSGQPIAWNSVQVRTGHESWGSFEWISGRLAAFEEGSYEPDIETQRVNRSEYGDTSDGKRFLYRQYVANEQTAKRKSPSSFQLNDESVLFETKLADGDTQCLVISTNSSLGHINRSGSDGIFRQQEIVELRYGRPVTLKDALDEMGHQAIKGTTVYPTDLRRGNVTRWVQHANLPKGYRMLGNFRDGVMESYLLFNDRNYLAERGKVLPSGERKPETKYEYQYDQHGNWNNAVQKSYENNAWLVVFRYVRQNEYFDGSNRVTAVRR